MARKKTNVQRKKGGHKPENMLRALILHRQGATIRKAARDSNVLYGTLHRYIKKYAAVSTEELKNQRLTPHYNINMIFTAEQEAELTAYIKECAATKALSTKEVRKAAYELAAVNNIRAPVGWEKAKMAGIDWLRSFRERNFGLKKPEVADGNVDAVEAVVKEFTEKKKVGSLNDALKTLKVIVDRKKAKADDGIVKMEHDSANSLTDKLVTRAGLVSDDEETSVILEDAHNELEEQNLESLNNDQASLDGTTAFNKDIQGTEVSVGEVCSQDPLYDTVDAEEDANTSVWSYYEREPGGRARCVVCRAVVTRAGLRAHLRSRHPKLVAEVDLGSEDEASDSQEDIYTEIVYLEDEQNEKKTKSAQRKHKAKPSIERSERKRHASSSSDDTPLNQKKTSSHVEKQENNDEIEQFGKYVTCLLRKIPPAACMELQAEIVNLIMKKQLELKRNETPVLAGTDKMADGCEKYENVPSTSLNTSNGYSNVAENKDVAT